MWRILRVAGPNGSNRGRQPKRWKIKRRGVTKNQSRQDKPPTRSVESVTIDVYVNVNSFGAIMPVLETKLNIRSTDFAANAAAMRALVQDLNAKIAKATLG